MPRKKRPNGYWNSWRNLKKEINGFFQENPKYKELPSHQVLISLGYSWLAMGIQKNRGFVEVRKKLRHRNGEKVKKGGWKNLEYTLNQARKIMKELGVETFPNEDYLRERGYSSICNAISRYHNGTNYFRKLLGEKTRNSPGTWESLEFTLEYAKRFLEEHPEYHILPPIRTLRILGENGFVESFYKYHGGYRIFREKLRQYMRRPSENEQLESMLEDYVGGSK